MKHFQYDYYSYIGIINGGLIRLTKPLIDRLKVGGKLPPPGNPGAGGCRVVPGLSKQGPHDNDDTYQPTG